MEMLEFVLLLLAAVLVSAVLDQVTPRVSGDTVLLAVSVLMLSGIVLKIRKEIA